MGILTQVKKVDPTILAAANKALIDKSKAVGGGQVFTSNQTTRGHSFPINLGRPVIRSVEHHLSSKAI